MRICRLWLLAAAIPIFCSSSALAQESSSSSRKIIVFRPDGDAINGRLIAVEDHHIVVLTTKTEEKISFEDISRIILTGESKPGMGALYGAVVGAYASTYLWGTDKNHAEKFLRSERYSALGILIIIAPSTLLAAGIGYLVDPGSDGKEEMFDFTGSESQRLAEQKRLKNTIKGNAREPAIHVSVQGSQVYPSIFKDNGPAGPYYSNDFNSLTNFNILRKLQVTYSVLPEAEVGISFVWFGEPARSSFWSEYFPSGDSRNISSATSLDAVGRYIVGVYKPFYKLLDRRFGFVVGAGIGLASIDCSSSATLNQSSYVNNQYVYTSQSSSFHVSDNSISGFFYGELNVKCDDGLTLGITVDHVLAASKAAPADPVRGISAQTLNFGNTSLGFTIGLHF